MWKYYRLKETVIAVQYNGNNEMEIEQLCDENVVPGILHEYDEYPEKITINGIPLLKDDFVVIDHYGGTVEVFSEEGFHDLYEECEVNDEDEDYLEDEPRYDKEEKETKKQPEYYYTTEEEKELIKKKYLTASFLETARSNLGEDGAIYVNDGGLLCGYIYRIDANSNVTIFARK